MTRKEAGFTLVEAMVVVAVIAVLLGVTLPLSSFWLERANLSTAKGELSQGFGKAIALALRNEQALDLGEPAAALCLTENSLTILEPTLTGGGAVQLPNCAATTGSNVWTAGLPANISLTNPDNGNAIGCMCFNSSGLLTENNCTGCHILPTVNIGIGNQLDIIDVR